ncbi:MAG: carboxymuconolactone decarboxylase family protein [Bacteroidetes bacterium]|nr:carboxymuconolactone decarboxylase family protein [Bacteroidota bacterium]MBS1932176.1 carboxymuconolactone decarboxylase family protein [Bacteroidota bacterium]
MRLDANKILPQGYKAMIELQQVVNQSNIEHKLMELVKIRASQINGCAYCLDMHTKDAIAIGENEQRLHVVAAWHEAPFYSERERAALAWCEALTKISESGAPDSAYKPLTKLFSQKEIIELTFAIIIINGWNRLAVGLRSEVGSYVSKLKLPAGSI